MRLIKIGFVFALIAANSAGATPLFSTPHFPGSSHNACKADTVALGFAPDNSALSVLRKNGYFLETPRDSKAKVKAHCHFSLVVNKPEVGDGILQIDFRGADSKLPLSEVELKISFGGAQYKAVYPRGQVLDGSSNFRRFQLANLPAGASKVEVEIEASARSVNSKDVVQISIDSFDACFVNLDANAGCATLSPAAPAAPAGQP
jgi:hypothetical protein